MASHREDPNLPVNEHLLMKEKGDFQQQSEDSDLELETSGERITWDKKMEYLLSMVGYSVGLGNIWRFPYVCMRNGGGAFLIPFCIALFIGAFPVFFLEVALGQFFGKSTMHAWIICPLFRGIGISMNILSVVLGWYCSMILGWTLIYVANSFKSPLPWTQCGQSWNTENCVTPEGFRYINKNDSNTILAPKLLTTSTLTSTVAPLLITNTPSVLGNGTTVFETTSEDFGNESVLSTDEFWLHNVLDLSSGIDDLGGLPWHTSVALIVSNVVVLFAIIKGIHSSGKAVYVTATLPYILLSIFLIMGCTLPGSGDGILFYIKPDFQKLLLIPTWVEAFIQVFYSLGPGWGGLVNMANYNKFNNNCLRDSFMLTVICEGTSIFGGFAVFSILGHMAYKAKIPITDFAKSGAGLTFIVYPEALSYLPISQFWAVIFFLMLFTLGLDTQFVNFEVIMTTIADIWPVFMRKWRYFVTTATMFVFTLFALIFATRGGSYVFQIVDWYSGAFSLLIQAALECVIIAWIYGADRFFFDIELMIGKKPPRIFVWAWKFISPGILIILQVFTLLYYKPPTFAGYTFPVFAQIIGWFFAVVPFSSAVLFCFYVLWREQGTLLQRLKNSCTPSPEWGPSDPEARKKYFYQRMPLSDRDDSLPNGQA